MPLLIREILNFMKKKNEKLEKQKHIICSLVHLENKKQKMKNRKHKKQKR